MSRQLLTAGFTVLALAAGCKPSPTRLNGDVFIVTKGGQNNKLGLVEVDLIAQPDVEKFVAANLENTRAELDRLKELLRKAQIDELLLAANTAADTSSIRRLTETVSAGPRRASLEMARAEHGTRIEFLQKQAAISQRKASIASEIARAEGGFYFAPELPVAPTVTTKTDADGKFAVTLMPGKYAAFARVKRDIGDTVETYTWLVWVAVAGDSEKRLILSNDNLVDSKSAECVLPWKKT